MATVKEKIEEKNKYVEDFHESAKRVISDTNTAVEEKLEAIKTYVKEFIE